MVIPLNEFVTRALVVPWKEKGRDYQGWDCWGSVVCAYSDVRGIILPSYAENYSEQDARRPSPAASDFLVGQMGAWELTTQPEPMDVALFTLAGRPAHVGVFLGGTRFLNVERDVGTAVGKTKSLAWEKRFEGIYRYVG